MKPQDPFAIPIPQSVQRFCERLASSAWPLVIATFFASCAYLLFMFGIVNRLLSHFPNAVTTVTPNNFSGAVFLFILSSAEIVRRLMERRRNAVRDWCMTFDALCKIGLIPESVRADLTLFVIARSTSIGLPGLGRKPSWSAARISRSLSSAEDGTSISRVALAPLVAACQSIPLNGGKIEDRDCAQVTLAIGETLELLGDRNAAEYTSTLGYEMLRVACPADDPVLQQTRVRLIERYKPALDAGKASNVPRKSVKRNEA
ncbi:MAG: hypothetical protein HOP29_02600 [Phycisphaerales bacterium]|nr:hypothetical protein [Phycisphaerales bacterium]